MNAPDIQTIKNNQRLQYSNDLKNNYTEFYDFLYSNYINKYHITQSEALYWYYNNITEAPTCKNCGKPVLYKTFATGYRDFCCRSCLSKSTSNKILEKYGTPCTLTLSEVKQKTIHTLEQHYGEGVTHNWKAKQVLEQCRNTCKQKYGEDYLKQNAQKAKQTCKQKYGDENYRNTNKSKKTCIEKYGVEHVSKSFTSDKKHEIQQKRIKTLRKNNSFNISSIENEFEEWLKENSIVYKTQYKSEKYPWCCDFYFPDYDVYLEIQGNWTHGIHAFDKDNPQDQLLLSMWKSKNNSFYNNAIETWTVRDVQKRTVAHENNLNYVEVFSINLKDVIASFMHAIKKN